jgi:carbamoyl-phosphate synthase small subunit
MKAVLLLEDGTIFKGKSFGSHGEAAGEAVFNTSMTGYQEILTDPSYYGQIVTMTYPQIGNYGINAADIESGKVQVSGFAVREFFDFFSNWRASGSLNNYLKENNVIGISEIDTRMLTRIIRVSGAMKCVISTETSDIKKLSEKIKSHPDMSGSDLVRFVTCRKSYEFNPEKKNFSFKIAAVDYGIKFNILRCLDNAGFKVTVVPASTPAGEILALNPDGVFLSNGPGDPAAVHYAIKNIMDLLGKKPLFGICLGHQLLALALGAGTYKLKFGHHGGNHPVKNISSGQVEITTQNHGFSVVENSLDKITGSSYRITHMNLNDNTIEGIEYPDLYAYSVQHHPEAGPGPFDARYIFKTFSAYISEFKKAGLT